MSPTVDADAEVVSGFCSATQQLLERRALGRRADSKFVTARQVIDDLLPRLCDEYALVYAGRSPIPRYETLYFDTAELRCFHDHRRGRRTRHKVRIRHYPDRLVSFLEVKSKGNDDVTQKARWPHRYADNALAPVDLHYIHTRCPPLAADLVPQVWTNFRRITLVGIRAHERVTIDLDLEYARGDRRESLRGVAIVEVKQHKLCVRSPVMQALRAAGLRPSSASKYCTAQLLTRNGLRANRLLPTLRSIEALRT